MSASAQCTPGDPVLLCAESKQLAYNSLIDQSQFLVQDKLYLHAGIDPQKSYTLASVLAVDATPGMQRLFWGNSPSIVLHSGYTTSLPTCGDGFEPQGG